MVFRGVITTFLLSARVLLHGQGIITTVAGTGSLGNSGNGGPATSAMLGAPTGVAVDKAGNIYIADSIFSVVRKVDSKGVISGFAGGGSPASLGDGEPATSARLGFLVGGHAGLAPDSQGNLYIADSFDSRIRKGNAVTGIITTVAGNSTFAGLGGFSVGSNAPATVFSPSEMPAFFSCPNNQVVATHEDFSWAVANGAFPGITTAPAKHGETIILWGTGFGPTTPAAPDGITTPSDKTYSTVLPTVEVNLVNATVHFAALAPGFAGLFQLAFQVPPSLGNGTHQVFATVGPPANNVPMLTVQQ
jgi:uncharacterized protein (TIGR03437 family)